MNPFENRFPIVLLISDDLERNRDWAPMLWWWGYDIQVSQTYAEARSHLPGPDILLCPVDEQVDAFVFIEEAWSIHRVRSVALFDFASTKRNIARLGGEAIAAVIQMPEHPGLDNIVMTVDPALGYNPKQKIERFDWTLEGRICPNCGGIGKTLSGSCHRCRGSGRSPAPYLDRPLRELNDMCMHTRYEMACLGVESLRHALSMNPISLYPHVRYAVSSHLKQRGIEVPERFEP